MNKKQYYKPKKLFAGVLIFGIAMLFVGILITVDVKDSVQDIKDILYTIGFILCFLAMVIGEGLILDAASFDVDNSKYEDDMSTRKAE